jgi:CheY-like chemotaxis protein
MAMGRVLVVDDEPDWRTTLSGLLADKGFDVKSASTLAEALQCLDEEHFHVAVLDVRLDDTNEDNRDGLWLMHQIRKRAPSTAVIILTGYSNVGMVVEALQPGRDGSAAPAQYFLSKNDVGKLHEFVRAAYERSLYKDFDLLIQQGETEKVEFKSSIRWDFQRKNVNKNLQVAFAKAAAGLLNQNGGVLLLGIDDNGNVLGIGSDLSTLREANTDEYQQTITEIISGCLNVKYMKYIHVHFEQVNQKQICVVSVDASPEPVYLTSGDEPELWVRIGNTTRRLDVKAAIDHIRNRWGDI